MADEIAIKVENVSKTFKLPHEKATTLKSAIINFYKRDKGFEKQEALKDISFEVKKGEFFGIVGRNGSGKSTLLKLLAGIYSADSGGIQINGKLTPFIELGVGFSPELSGRENVFLNGALLGFNRKEMNAMYNDIVEFSELARFMDQKLKNYSSGMQVRLAFSIAIRAESDILLLDEVLAVGDAAFQRKCFDYFMQLKRNKRTVILVTHDMGAVRQYCDLALMLEDSQIVKYGTPEMVAQSYTKLFIDESNAKKQSNMPESITSNDRWGSGELQVFRPESEVKDDSIILKCDYVAQANLPAPTLGFSVYNPAGINIVEGNTKRSKIKTKALKKGEHLVYQWIIPNVFSNGIYDVSFACCDQSETLFYDWFNRATSFNINKETTTGSMVDPVILTKEIS